VKRLVADKAASMPADLAARGIVTAAPGERLHLHPLRRVAVG
jgi:hypothetical protein